MSTISVNRCDIEVKSYRIPMPVTRFLKYESGIYCVCPRCGITLEWEFMRFCDRCGQ